CSRCPTVDATAAGLRLTRIPELAHGLSLAQVVRSQLEDRFRAWLRPELLAPLYAFVHHLDHRLHGAGHDWQTLATVVVISHSVGVVLQVAQRLEDSLPRVAVGALGWRCTQDCGTFFQLSQDRRHLTRPDGLNPSLVNLRPLGHGTPRERRREHVTQSVHEVENRREGSKVSALDRPVHRQAVSQESPSLRPEEVALPGRLMHHRAEFFGALSAGQNTADQTLGTARTGLATILFFRRLVLLPRLVFAIELQAGWKGVTQAAYHLFRPLQVEKTARHVGIGVGFMDIALIGFQDRDFGLSPVTVLLRLRWVRSDLQSAPVDRHHRH